MYSLSVINCYNIQTFEFVRYQNKKGIIETKTDSFNMG